MWLIAEERFVRHVCLRNLFRLFLLGIPSIHSLPQGWGSWELQYAPPAPRYGCIMPIPSLQLQKRISLMQRRRGFGRGVVFSKMCCNAVIVLSVVLCDYCKPMDNCELLATVGWKWGCQPFSCRCTQNVTHCRKEICGTCLFKESSAAIPFGNSKHPTNPCQKQVPESRSTLQQLCVMAASCSFLRCSWKEKPVSRREAEGLVTELWFARFATMQWLCSQLCYVTAANQWTIVEIELLATVGWKWGCQPFSCPRTQNVTHCRKEICSTCLSEESIPAISSGNSKHPLPTTRFRFPRAAVRSTSFALWLHHAFPFVAAAEKKPVSCTEAEGLVAELFSPRFVTTQWLCSQLCHVTAANQCQIVEIELLATVGWKWGCERFCFRCTQNVT